MRSAGGRLAAALLSAALAGTAAAQQLYKCGGSYQDRPCADVDVQKRYAHGRFDVDQVNPDTDADCARVVGDLMPFWKRLHSGESLDSVRAQVDARPISRQEKSRMRDLLLALNGVDGNEHTARSQLETQCMTYKHVKGLPTEAQARDARASGGAMPTPPMKQRR